MKLDIARSKKRQWSQEAKTKDAKTSFARRIHPTNVRNSSRRMVNKFFDSTFLAVRRVAVATSAFQPKKKIHQNRELLEQITELLASPSEVVRASALQAYLQLPLPLAEYRTIAFHGLTIGLRDQQPRVRRQAVVLLGQFIEAYADHWEHGIPLLNDCCHDPAMSVAKKAHEILERQHAKKEKIQKTYLVK
ncbi:MAG: hypothetical protein WC497_04130 [Patescibacteria group bacterium]